MSFASLFEARGRNEAVIWMFCSSILQIFCNNVSRPTQVRLPADIGDTCSLRAASQSSLMATEAHLGELCHDLFFTAHRAESVLVHDRLLANGRNMS